MPLLTRRQTLLTGTAAMGALAAPWIARAQSADDIVIGSSSPITGVFANVGVDLNAAMQHYTDWRNEQGGINGRRLRFVWEDSAYRTNESVAIFRKLMAQDNPQLYYGDSTGWAKAVASELTSRATTMSSAPSFSSDLADPDKVTLRRNAQEFQGPLTQRDGVFRSVTLLSGDEVIVGRQRQFFRNYVLPTVGFLGSIASIYRVVERF